MIQTVPTAPGPAFVSRRESPRHPQAPCLAPEGATLRQAASGPGIRAHLRSSTRARRWPSCDGLAARTPAPTDPSGLGSAGRALEDRSWPARQLTRTSVPCPLGLSTRSWPSSAATRSESPRRPPPAVSIVAPPLPSSLTSSIRLMPSRSTVRLHPRSVRVLHHVRQRLGDDEVRGRLNGWIQPANVVA